MRLSQTCTVASFLSLAINGATAAVIDPESERDQVHVLNSWVDPQRDRVECAQKMRRLIQTPSNEQRLRSPKPVKLSQKQGKPPLTKRAAKARPNKPAAIKPPTNQLPLQKKPTAARPASDRPRAVKVPPNQAPLPGVRAGNQPKERAPQKKLLGGKPPPGPVKPPPGPGKPPPEKPTLDKPMSQAHASKTRVESKASAQSAPGGSHTGMPGNQGNPDRTQKLQAVKAGLKRVREIGERLANVTPSLDRPGEAAQRLDEVKAGLQQLRGIEANLEMAIPGLEQPAGTSNPVGKEAASPTQASSPATTDTRSSVSQVSIDPKLLPTITVPPATKVKPSKVSLTMTAILGSATPFQQAGDLDAKVLGDNIYYLLDKGCKQNPGPDWRSGKERLCPNDISIDKVNVFSGQGTTAGSLRVLVDVMNYRDDVIRKVLITLIAGIARSAINSESQRKVKFRAGLGGLLQQWPPERAKSPLDKRDTSPADQHDVFRLQRRGDVGWGQLQRYEIVQAVLPNSFSATVVDLSSGEIVGSAVLLPQWVAPKADIFSRLMCHAAMAFIQSTLIGEVSSAVDTVASIAGVSVNPCDGFG